MVEHCKKQGRGVRLSVRARLVQERSPDGEVRGTFFVPDPTAPSLFEGPITEAFVGREGLNLTYLKMDEEPHKRRTAVSYRRDFHGSLTIKSQDGVLTLTNR